MITNRQHWADRAADALHRVRAEPVTDEQMVLLALALESVTATMPATDRTYRSHLEVVR